jgi:aspartyl-tRNA(Asn)/glutamyl-tRNA(Gln) amidotransferase subunit B
MSYEVVIGLEVHARLLTESKIFCACSTHFGSEPNEHACPVCLGMPGSLPVLNRKAVELALRAALATESRILPVSMFNRKNYFYPDLPKSYQISQLEMPLCRGGKIEIQLQGRPDKVIRLNRIHMEEDAGKLVHDPALPLSYVDYNRAGAGLIEIVTEPDLRSPEEAVAYLKTLHDILVYAQVCDGNMEEGSFRCDANISLRPRGQEKLGAKVELKNMNSFRFVQKALEYEAGRQRTILERGGTIVQQTRLWDTAAGRTETMREKEEAHDYRYFPDPDLLPLELDAAFIENVRLNLPELPAARKARLQNDYQLSAYDAGVLTSSRFLADYFEQVTGAGVEAKTAGNWIMTEMLAVLNNEEDPRVIMPPERLSGLLQLLHKGEISGAMAKKVFARMIATGKEAALIISEEGLKQLSDSRALEKILQDIFTAHPSQVEEYKAGKDKLAGFFVGLAMKQSKGQANPAMLNELIIKMLGR